MEHQNYIETTAKVPTKNHSKMNHRTVQLIANLSMGMDGHNYNAMRIADFKKRFYVAAETTGIPVKK